MEFTREWDNTTPPDTQKCGLADLDIREMREDIQERMESDHNFSGGSVYDSSVNSDGTHNKVTLFETEKPSVVAGAGIVFVDYEEGSQQLFFLDEDGREIQITGKRRDVYSAYSESSGDDISVSISVISGDVFSIGTFFDSTSGITIDISIAGVLGQAYYWDYFRIARSGYNYYEAMCRFGESGSATITINFSSNVGKRWIFAKRIF